MAQPAHGPPRTARSGTKPHACLPLRAPRISGRYLPPSKIVTIRGRRCPAPSARDPPIWRDSGRHTCGGGGALIRVFWCPALAMPSGPSRVSWQRMFGGSGNRRPVDIDVLRTAATMGVGPAGAGDHSHGAATLVLAGGALGTGYRSCRVSAPGPAWLGGRGVCGMASGRRPAWGPGCWSLRLRSGCGGRPLRSTLCRRSVSRRRCSR